MLGPCRQHKYSQTGETELSATCDVYQRSRDGRGQIRGQLPAQAKISETAMAK